MQATKLCTCSPIGKIKLAALFKVKHEGFVWISLLPMLKVGNWKKKSNQQNATQFFPRINLLSKISPKKVSIIFNLRENKLIKSTRLTKKKNKFASV